MDTLDIKGKELHFIRRVINKQKHNDPFSLTLLNDARFTAQWSEEFIKNLESKNLLRFNDGFIYATDLAIRSVYEKDRRENLLIEEQMVEDGFIHTFLTFMNNRDEPVLILDMPNNFAYHSEIHMKPVEGKDGLYRTWEDEVYKYIENPTIDGYVLNHAGKTMLAKLNREKRQRQESEVLDIEVKRQTVTGTRFSRNVAYISLFVAAITAFVPIFIWWKDKDKTQKTKTEIPQLEQAIQTQQQTQQILQDVQRTLQSLDTSVKKVKIEK